MLKLTAALLNVASFANIEEEIPGTLWPVDIINLQEVPDNAEALNALEELDIEEESSEILREIVKPPVADKEYTQYTIE